MNMMAKTLEQILAERPVDRAAVEAHKARMIDEMRAYRLQELRKSVSMTQEQLAERLGVGQNRVSTIEHGDLERVRIDTLRRYVEAVGGSLRVEVELRERYILGEADRAGGCVTCWVGVYPNAVAFTAPGPGS